MTEKYTLKEAREILGFSKKKLSEDSGISMAAISAIEGGGAYKTSEGVALALSEALALEVYEIDWPRGLSHLGRPAKTGKPIGMSVKRVFTITVTEEVTVTSDRPLCSTCFTELPAVARCDYCSPR